MNEKNMRRDEFETSNKRRHCTRYTRQEYTQSRRELKEENN